MSATSSLGLLTGRVLAIGFLGELADPLVEEDEEVQHAVVPRHISVNRMPHMKLVLQRAKIDTPVCSMSEGLIETDVDGWLQTDESMTAPGVECEKATSQ